MMFHGVSDRLVQTSRPEVDVRKSLLAGQLVIQILVICTRSIVPEVTAKWLFEGQDSPTSRSGIRCLKVIMTIYYHPEGLALRLQMLR